LEQRLLVAVPVLREQHRTRARQLDGDGNAEHDGRKDHKQQQRADHAEAGMLATAVSHAIASANWRGRLGTGSLLLRSTHMT
jgi:hypothetical protein